MGDGELVWGEEGGVVCQVAASTADVAETRLCVETAGGAREAGISGFRWKQQL